MDSSQPLVDMLTQDFEADLEVLTQAPMIVAVAEGGEETTITMKTSSCVGLGWP